MGDQFDDEPDRSWSEVRAILAEHGIFTIADGPIIFNEGLIASIRRRLEEHPNPPVSPEEAERVMSGLLMDVRAAPNPFADEGDELPAADE